MNFILGFFLLGVSWLQPVHIFPWVSWHSEALAFLAILIIGWERIYLALKKRTSGAITFPFATLPIFAMGAIIGLQWFFGLIVFRGDAIVYTAYLVLCVASMSLGFTAERENFSPMCVLAGAIVFGAVCSAFVAFAQVFEVWDSYEWIHRAQYSRRPGANLGQPNQLATLLLMGIASLAYLLESRKLGCVLASVLTGVLLFALAATESRAGLIGFLALITWWFFKGRAIATRTSSRWVIVFCLTYVGLFLVWPMLMAGIFQIDGGISAFNNPNALKRWMIWPQLIQAVLMRPWLGWGYGQVSTAHNAVADGYAKSEPYTYAHSIVLDLALGVGLPMAILFMMCVVVWLWRRVRAVQQLEPWYCIAVVIPCAVHSLVEFPFAYSYFLLPVMLAIGALEAQLGGAVAFRTGIRQNATSLLIMTIAFMWSVVEYLPIEEDLRVVRFEALHVGKTPEDYQRPKVRVFTQLDALLYGFRLVPKPNMSTEEVELSRLAALHFPMISTQNKHALSLALNGNPVEAIRQLHIIRSMYGEIKYQTIAERWKELANGEYPQLLDLKIL